jgi:hypothetical protein
MKRPRTPKVRRQNHCVLGGDGGESNRPATNSPGIAVDLNRFNCLVEKSGLGVEPRPLQSPIKQDRSVYIGCSALANALRSGSLGLYYGIICRLTSGCSAVASALRSGPRGLYYGIKIRTSSGCRAVASHPGFSRYAKYSLKNRLTRPAISSSLPSQ